MSTCLAPVARIRATGAWHRSPNPRTNHGLFPQPFLDPLVVRTMPRPPRSEAPGFWHHVMNRGIAHRAVFEDKRCIRMFLSLVARAVRDKRIEVHAFSILTTHYHLLVRSLDGRLSETMQRIQNEYVRWFNATHDRDGPLFKGRFQSRHVTSEMYRRVLVRYIDDNARAAGLAMFAADYPHASAHSYVHRSGPRWLTRTFVEGLVSERTGRAFHPDGYAQVFGRRLDVQASTHLARTIESSSDPQGALDGFLRSTPAHVQAWLRERAKLADGAAASTVLCAPAPLAVAVSRIGAEWIDSGLTREAVHAALMVQVCGLSQHEVARTLGESRWFVSRALHAHRRCLATSAQYAAHCSQIVHEALIDGHVAVALGLASRLES
jgi:hypothetical protein